MRTVLNMCKRKGPSRSGVRRFSFHDHMFGKIDVKLSGGPVLAKSLTADKVGEIPSDDRNEMKELPIQQ